MNVLKTSIWSGESTNQSDSMAVYFCFLTLYARARPVVDVFIDAGPNVALSDKVLCGVNSRMRDTMKIVKNETMI